MLFEACSIGDLKTPQHLTVLTQSNNFKGKMSEALDPNRTKFPERQCLMFWASYLCFHLTIL